MFDVAVLQNRILLLVTSDLSDETTVTIFGSVKEQTLET